MEASVELARECAADLADSPIHSLLGQGRLVILGPAGDDDRKMWTGSVNLKGGPV